MGLSNVDLMTAKHKAHKKSSEEEKVAFLELLDGVRTTPRQHKFPSVNQAPHCWNRYNEWVLCLKSTKGDHNKCSMMRQYADSICPDEWTEKWDEERGEKIFPGLQSDV